MWFIYWITSIYVIAYLIYYGFQKRLEEIKVTNAKLLNYKKTKCIREYKPVI